MPADRIHGRSVLPNRHSPCQQPVIYVEITGVMHGWISPMSPQISLPALHGWNLQGGIIRGCGWTSPGTPWYWTTPWRTWLQERRKPRLPYSVNTWVPYGPRRQTTSDSTFWSCTLPVRSAWNPKSSVTAPKIECSTAAKWCSWCLPCELLVIATTIGKWKLFKVIFFVI